MEKTIKSIACQLGFCIEDNSKIFNCQIDSRLICENDLFFALKGKNVDGHDFLKEISLKKAKAAVVSNDYIGDDYGLVLLRVDNVLEALHTLAKKWIEDYQGKIVGVTGSVGKTTVKEFIAQLISKKYTVYKSVKSYNSQRTLPIVVLNFSKEEQILILEMAMSEKGQIKKLIDIAPLDIAVVTGAYICHAENFESIEDIASAKLEILSNPKTKIAVLNKNLLQYQNLLKEYKHKIVTYSIEQRDSDFYLLQDNEFVHMDIEGVREKSFQLSIKENLIVEDLLAAIAVSYQLGLTLDDMLDEFDNLKMPSMRYEKVFINDILFVKDCFNANPVAVKRALLDLPFPKDNAKTIAVLGSMKELGKFSKESHFEVGKIAAKKVDTLLCYGQECLSMVDAYEEEGKEAFLFQDKKLLVEKLKKIIQRGDIVLVKGSRSLKMWEVIEDIEKEYIQ